MNRNQRKRINKIVLSMFLSLAILTWFSKAIIGVLYDFGFFTGHLNLGWWNGLKPDPNDPNYDFIIDALNKRPLFLWMFTQFTWLTTTMMIIFLMFRFFAFDERVPRWLRWIRSQRTLSSIMIYEINVLVIFWLAIALAKEKPIHGFFKDWEIGVTILVHAILPILFTIYGVIFLINDQKASLLREGFVLKGMLWPTIYSVYYVVVALAWYDPYPLTNFHDEFEVSLIKMIGALFSIYALIGLMTIGHNFILLRFNKNYNPTMDNDALWQRELIIERIARKAGRKFIHKNKKFHHEIVALTHEINNLEKKFHSQSKHHKWHKKWHKKIKR